MPGGDHKRPAFLAKNPSGAVPALELDDGTMISECTAITEYLYDQAGDPMLTGRTPKKRAVVHMMQRRIEAGLLDAVAAYFHHTTPGLGPDIETYQNPRMGRVPARACRRHHARELATRPYMAGETFTMADISAMAGLAYADFAKVETLAECANLAAWRARVNARPSVAASA